MSKHWKFVRLCICIVLVLSLVSVLIPSTAAASVTPVVVSGNPNCVGLGYGFGFKPQPEPPPTGTYNFPDGINSVTITSDGTIFSWTSTIGIDAVIVKGGPQANIYVYNPEATSDTQLNPPVNPSGGFAAISHIEFCYDYELTASKTANTEWKQIYTWTIDKSVDDNSHTGFAGDSFTSNYDVSVDQTVTNTYKISGNITINNPTPYTVNFSVTDSINGGVGNATVSCPQTQLAPGASVVCSYQVSPSGAIGTLNTATVTSSTSSVGGATATAAVTWGQPIVEGYPTVNVTDNFNSQGNSPLGSASDDKTFSYSRNFTCPTSITSYTNGVYTQTFPNTATITETGQNDSESVTLTCYAPVASKTANTSYDRDWTWSITKTGDQTNITLSTGQSFAVNYAVTVSAVSDDGNFLVYGSITVQNPSPSAMDVTVSDSVGGTAATIDCGGGAGDTSLTVGANSSASCSYSADLGDGDKPAAGTNTATVTLANGTAFQATAPYSFGDPTTETDECITVSDDQYGSLGQVCANQLPKTFNYTMNVGPYATCGTRTFTNVASFVTNDNGETGNDNHTVNVNVPCNTGCTLTQGYWKTHSSYGPAPYDNTWALLPGGQGANTLFFDTGKTWLVTFKTPPAGNAFFILAHQYMAAVLNQLNGATVPPAIQTTMTQAATLLNQYDTNQGAIKNSIKNQFTTLAATLDSYNNGNQGVPHCSEQQ